MLTASRSPMWKRFFSGLVLTGSLLAPHLHAEPGATPPEKGSAEATPPSAEPSRNASGRKGPRKAKGHKARQERRERTAEDREKRRSRRLRAGADQLRKRAQRLRKQAESDKPIKPSLRPNAKPKTKESLLADATKLENKADALEQRAQSPQSAPTATSMKEARPRRDSRRASTRKSRRAFLRKRWGSKLRQPAVKAELARNARRLARLKQIRKLAQKSKDDETAKRATSLIIREQARHRAAMRAATTPADQSKANP